MATTFKLIKSKQFEVKGVKHTHYVGAYKGRVFGISTLNCEEGEIQVDEKANTIKVDCSVEVKQEVTIDDITGDRTSYLSIMPKLGLELATI